MRGRILALAVAIALLVSAVGLAAGAQTTPTVGVEVPNSVSQGSTAGGSLVVTDVSDPDGVGSFTVNVTYDPAVVSVSASGTSTFDVSTSTPEPGVLRIVGYTGDYPGPQGTVTLANVDVTGDAQGSSAIDTAVETLTDADGNPLANTTSSDSISVTSGGGSSSDPPADTDDSGTGSGAGSSGGGSADVSVTSASLSTTAVSVGESVTVTATAENTGSKRGSIDLRLVVDGSDTGTSRSLEVPAGSSRSASVTTTFDAPGEYEVSFGGVVAGSVTVTGDGTAPTPTVSPEPTETAEPGASPSETATSSPTETPTGQPGFGLLVAVLAGLVAAGLAARRP